jgi:hypothetical protein
MNQPRTPSLRPGSLALCFLCVLFLAPMGCRKSTGIPVYPVRGEVFVAGQPAIGAEVMFHPLGADPTRRFASATVQADGSFQLTTIKANDGAPPGEYAISITWCDEYRDEGERRTGPDRLQWRFYDPATSGLKFTVATGNNAVPRFDLN